jgi:hypothetical protein
VQRPPFSLQIPPWGTAMVEDRGVELLEEELRWDPADDGERPF